ncbi:hypothetical protein DOE73_20545 [Paenibacillus dendritiformis]|nr:hypothetical protein DOE73_20545 [Paenibacillus dendritiformis]
MLLSFFGSNIVYLLMRKSLDFLEQFRKEAEGMKENVDLVYKFGMFLIAFLGLIVSIISIALK